jgi:DNA-binding response OmpR family regulator
VIRILLVEDDPDHAELIRFALEDAAPGSEIHWIDHGTRAIEHFDRCIAGDEQPPDLVFLDWKLPGHKGDEVLRHIRGAAALNGLPVAVLTSSSHQGDRDLAVQLGANRYLIKSLAASALESTLRTTIDELCGET